MPIASELRVRTGDAGDTTVYVTRHPLDRTSVRLVCFPAPTRLDHWCVANGEPEAILAGFFLRDPDRPLGQVVLGGRRLGHEPTGAGPASTPGSSSASSRGCWSTSAPTRRSTSTEPGRRR